MEYITITGRIKEIYGLARIASGLCGAPSFLIKLGHVSDCLILSNHDHKSRANIIDSFEWVRTEGVMSVWSNN